MKLSQLLGFFGGLLLGLPLAAAADDQDDGSQRFELSGFGTLAAYRGGSDVVGVKPDPRTPNLSNGDWRTNGDTRLAGQVRWQVSERLEAVMQVLVQDDIAKRMRPRTEWAYIGWSPAPAWTLRLGRQTLPFFLVSETRNVGYAQTALRPMNTVYSINPGAAVDGLNLTWTGDALGGLLSLDLGGGTARVDLSSGSIDINRSTVLVGNWRRGNWQLRAGVSAYAVDLTNSGAATLLKPPGCANCNEVLAPRAALSSEGRLTYLGLVWQAHDWTLTAEAALRDSNSLLVAKQAGWYVQASRRIGAWTPYASVGQTTYRESPLGLQAVPNSPPALVQGLKILDTYLQSPFDRRVIQVGVRLDLGEHWALKFQQDFWTATRDRSTGRAAELSLNAPPLGPPLQKSWDGHANMSTISLDFVF
ncbi:hypothetical protein [Roseateles sp. PN1]|uniref:hypothetical protein n=1 Tax=Roseateles sp. PN1 TaxID=3137372 RepID=UPI003139D792